MTKIGFAGIGRMGAGMLRNLRKGGFDAVGFDIRPESDFPDLPVTNDVVQFADGLTQLHTIVRDAAETDEVLFSTQGFVAHTPTLERIVVHSTLSPKYVLGLRDKIPAHIDLVDAPMSGAEVGAIEATLAFMIGGSDASIGALMAQFNAMGTNIHHMGDYGMGMQAKVLNNLLCASHTAMSRLILSWADEAGLDQGKLLGLIETATGQNWFTSKFDKIEFAQQGFELENTLGILAKDVGCALDAAPEGANKALPELIRQNIRDMKPI